MYCIVSHGLAIVGCTSVRIACSRRDALGDFALGCFVRGSEVIGSSEQVHVMDALAMIGDEGRDSLRKAAGSRQMGADPQISEWGNPLR